MSNSDLDRQTAHDYAKTVRDYLGLLTNDQEKIEQVTGRLINQSYNHFVQFFARNPNHLKSYQPTNTIDINKVLEIVGEDEGLSAQSAYDAKVCGHPEADRHPKMRRS